MRMALCATMALLWAGAAAAGCPAKMRVHKDGSVDLDGVRYARVDAKVTARAKGCAVVVEADKDVSYDTIGRILAALQMAGGGKIGFQDDH